MLGHPLQTVNKSASTSSDRHAAASYYGRIVSSAVVPCVVETMLSLVNQFTRSRVIPAPSVEGSVMSLPKPGERDLRLDSFRGLALWLIFLDHLPSNVVNWVTIRNY